MDSTPKPTREVGTPPVRELPTPIESMSKNIRVLSARLDKLEAHLSFLEMYKPKIERLIAICHAAKIIWSILWKLIAAFGLIFGIYLGGIQMGWWPSIQSQPASVTSQTLQDSPDSFLPGSYTGSKTHSHSFADIQPKRGDKSPTRPSSK